MGLSYVLVVLAAAANAASNILQRKADREEAPELSMRPRLVLDLLRKPVWLAGFGTVILSFLLLATALDMGSLAAVDPVIVIELPLTLWLASKVLGGRLGRREWLAIGALTLGLSGLIGFLSPHAGRGGATTAVDWILASGTTVAIIGCFVLVGSWSRGARRAALLGIATGMTFGLTSAYMKGMTAQFHGGVVGVLSTWPTYAMVASGLAGMFLLQSAFQAGRLIAAQPGVTLLDPTVAIIWGVFVFHESTSGGLLLFMAGVSGVLMASGAVILARSPLLEPEPATMRAQKQPRSRKF